MSNKEHVVTQKEFKNYLDDFISRHRVILRPEFNYFADAIVSTKDGSLLFIEFKEGKGSFKYEKTDEKIANVLMNLPQKAFAGNLSNVKFGGVNVIREGNKLIIIKGDNSSNSWSRNEAKKDAFREIRDIRNMFAHGRK